MPAIVIPAPISSNHAAPVSAGGTGATTAAAARTNLDVYSKSEVTNAIAQSTAYVTEYVNIGAEDMLAKIAQMSANKMIYFRTTSTTTNGPRSGVYLIGTAIRTGNSINISATDMVNPTVIYQNGTNTGGTTWSGWTRNGCLVFGNITASEIYDILCQLPIGHSMPFITTNANSSAILSGNKVSALLKGIVGRTGADGQYFDFFCAHGSTQYIYTWQVTATSASSITPGTVYRYTGTAI